MPIRVHIGAILVAGLFCIATPVTAQQRPLVTEDPETVGSGRILLEGGLDVEQDVFYPLSGLSGDLLSVPVLGISIGVSSIAELQVDGGFYQRLRITGRQQAPLSPLVDVPGDQATSVRDTLIGTKIRFLSEAPSRPVMGVRFATRLPTASNESGLGRDTTDFALGLLVGKTIRSLRVVGNVGFLLLEDPTAPARQDDLLTYGLSFARALAEGFEIVGEANGRENVGENPVPGAEDRAIARVGARFTRGSARVDGALLIGLGSLDPTIGFTTGLTWVFNAFRVP
jgi:hypothetical protein